MGWGAKACLEGRIALDMIRESRAEGREQTTETLHQAIDGEGSFASRVVDPILSLTATLVKFTETEQDECPSFDVKVGTSFLNAIVIRSLARKQELTQL